MRKTRQRRASKDHRQIDLETALAFDEALATMAAGTGLSPTDLLGRLSDSDVALSVFARKLGRQLPYAADAAQLRQSALAIAAAKQQRPEAAR